MAGSKPTPTVIRSSAVRAPLYSAARAAKQWFYTRTSRIVRTTYRKKGGIKDSGKGAVYAYFAKGGKCLYVGQTGRSVKARKHDQTSPHKNAVWWTAWTYMRFINLPDEMDRLTLEFLLILALKPRHNTKPKYKPISKILPPP